MRTRETKSTLISSVLSFSSKQYPPNATEPSIVARAASPSAYEGDPVTPTDCPGIGILITNLDNKYTEFNFYDNFWNGNGEAGANFNEPDPKTVVNQGETVFVPLDTSFKGSVRRGWNLPSTWAEFQVQADDGASWSDSKS